jgi:hypothetical protein
LRLGGELLNAFLIRSGGFPMGLNELFSKMSGEDFGMTVMIAGTILIALTAIIGGCIVKVIKSNNQTRLKQEMIARGMSLDEIKAVLEIGSKK